MSLALLFSRARKGVSSPLVMVEVHLSNGLPSLSIVGLPEKAVQESKDRVRGAIINSGFEFPARRITVNLAPADLPKEGGCFDLPIALGILAASEQIVRDRLEQHEFLGELALSGHLRPVRGALPAALATRQTQRALILPEENAAEASHVQQLCVLGANHLLQVCRHLADDETIPPFTQKSEETLQISHPDMSDVKGQPQAKRAFEIAAAGAHSLLVLGPPGSGKSMLAKRLPGILPPMSETEALETASILSVSQGGFESKHWRIRPFRSPHHTASAAALVGGGSQPRPGEISLAHNGVLFLDELPEFDRKVLEVLREPMENGNIAISRAAERAEFPARFQLIAAMNPCPCGYLGDSHHRCECSVEQIRRYRAKISGPLLDRIDLHVEAPRLPTELLTEAGHEGETSRSIQKRVIAARQQQLDRSGKSNNLLSPKEVEFFCHPDAQGTSLIQGAIQKLGLSARAYHRILKVARTIADLAGAEQIAITHIAEAIGYRRLDRSPPK